MRNPVIKLHPSGHAIDRAIQIRVPTASFDEILLRRYVLRPNAPGRGGSHLLIGRNFQGDCLAIPVSSADHEGEGTAITFWRCDAAEEKAIGR